MTPLAGLLDLFYPPDLDCLCCGARLGQGEAGLCGDCWEDLTALPDPGRDPTVELAQTMHALPHLGPARELVHRLKYGGLRCAAQPLSRLMAEALRGEWDALVAIPLHRRRQRERGFNQAQALAQGLSQRTGLPVIAALRRQRATARQVGLDAAQRRENVRDAFVCDREVLGKRLLLVDDVMTSGSTALAAAKALWDAGAARVGLITATRAMPDDEEM